MFLIGSIQEAISDLLRTAEPRFLASALNVWYSLSVIVLIVAGVKAWAHDRTLESVLYTLGQTLIAIFLARIMLVFYMTPIPGVGYSFPQLITAPAFHFMNVLDVGSVESMYGQVSDMWGRVMMPSVWAWVPMILYVVFLIELLVVKMLVLYVIAWPLIAVAVLQLLGPLALPFVLWRQFNWIFWGWMRAFIQYSFVPVVAMAYLMIAERFVARFLTSIPTVIAVADFGVYLFNAMVVFFFLGAGLWKIPGLTAALFSGHLHHQDGGIRLTQAAVRTAKA